MELNINVEGIKVWGKHGVYASESIAGNWFLVDVSVLANVREEAVLNDELSATCDYSIVHQLVLEVMEKPVQLLEKLALEIAHRIKSGDSRILNVKVKVSKLQPPLSGEVAATSVEIQL